MSKLDEIAARAEVALRGPWHAHQQPDGSWWIESEDERDIADIRVGRNVSFIAHAREDIPYLLDLLTAAEERVAALEQALSGRDLDARTFDAAIDRAERAEERVRVLEEALGFLLDDTQHDDHVCFDPECPVVAARAALAASGEVAT